MEATRSYFLDRRMHFLGWCIVGLFLVIPYAFAHTSLEKYVRESVNISLSAENVDFRIQFDFPAALSLPERKRMDHDADGAISKNEQQAYLKAIQEYAETHMPLLINGKPATLIPLEDPVLDLQDAQNVEAHPHSLQLTWFARLPKTFGARSTIVLDSGVWTGIPLLLSVSTETAEGIQVHATNAQGLVQPSNEDTKIRITEVQCLRWKPANQKSGRN